MKIPKCTACGSPLIDIDALASVVKCSYCGSKVVVANANTLKDVEIDRSKELANQWLRLSSAIESNAVQNISRYASQILQIIPNDYRAKYYFAYAEDFLNQHSYISRFYKAKPEATTEEEVEEIVKHIFKYSRLRDQSLVLGYLKKVSVLVNVDYKEEYLEWFENRKEIEENYDAIPRDVFICYRSTDQEMANRVVAELEADGNKCWIASRNLRPGDSQNYWTNIEQAIIDCKIFLVIHSSSAMFSDDVKKEMKIARLNEKPRLQFKIDESIPTSYFKDFFDGVPWIDGYSHTQLDFTDLKKRVYTVIHDLIYENYEKERQAKIHDQPASTIQEGRLEELNHPLHTFSKDDYLDSLLKKILVDIENRVFEDAKKDLDSALYIDARNGYIWWLKLFVEFEVDSEVKLAQFNDVLTTRSFKNAKAFGDEPLKEKVARLEQAVFERKEEIRRREEELEKKRQENIRNEQKRIELEEKRKQERALLEEKKEKRLAIKTEDEEQKKVQEKLQALTTSYEAANKKIESQIVEYQKARHRFEPLLMSKWLATTVLIIYIIYHISVLASHNPTMLHVIIINFGTLLIWPILLFNIFT